MPFTTSSVDELNSRTIAAMERTFPLLRSVDPTLRLIDSEWTAREVTVHLLNVLHRYIERDFRDPAGLSEKPTGLGDLNAAELAACNDLSHAEALDQLEAQAPRFFDLDLPLDARIPFHGGTSIDGLGARSNWMGELLVHGWDVARAAGRAWPLPERDIVLMLHANFQVAGAWLDPSKTGNRRIKVALKIPNTTPQVFDIAGGRGTIRDLEPGERLDSVIRSRATPAALMFWGRIGLLGGIRRGVMITGGRRPWLGMNLPKRFLPT